MKRALIYFLFYLFSISAYAQNYTLIGEIGQFSNASSFSINPAGFIYIADLGKNEIYKMDTLGTKLKFIGGFGWSESAFDNPSDIFATTLNVYVTDKNNSRIQIFDKDLNYLSQFKTDKSENPDLQFAYPECSVVSNQGDLYILDSDNSRILKYGMSGNFLLEIGGNDAGEFSLSNPVNFAISGEGKLYVIDKDMIFVFDQYGTGLFKISIGMDADNISISKDKLLINDTDKIQIIDFKKLNDGIITIDSSQLNIDTPIKGSILSGGKLYVLTETTIQIFEFLQ
ncbi:MAG: NHL repeat-containing protein [Bacteroidetes bacterium]|nr:NHL repeat-containing protein [Bacteroidota bacterium]